MNSISGVKANQIKDSRGKPTVEVTIETNDGKKAKASVPSGASTGSGEAKVVEVDKAIENIEKEIAPKIIGQMVTAQRDIDRMMIDLDGTENKERLGANAILGVSLACARAAAESKNIPLFQYIDSLMPEGKNVSMPVPMFNLINGGKHAHNNIDFQEFMVVPSGINGFKNQLNAGVKIFETLKTVLENKGLKTNMGDEGGYAPDLDTNEMAFGLLMEAIEAAGFRPGKEVFLALDVAASSLPPTFQLNTDRYHSLVNTFPIISIEDPLPEDDWHWWAQLKLEMDQRNKTGRQIHLIGDDLFVTHIDRLRKGINQYVANAILVKVNQVGTLSETLDVVGLAKENNYTHIVSHRSGETGDSFIADLAVGTGAQYIKAGAPNKEHAERMAKYDRLVEIEKELEK